VDAGAKRPGGGENGGALAFGSRLGYFPTLVEAGYSAAQTHQLRGEASLVNDHAREAMELADAYGLEFWMPYGVVMLGWAEAELRDREKGIEQIRRGLMLIKPPAPGCGVPTFWDC
jgi:hypothetical protein